MLDFELAELYGYTTKVFNQQVKNNVTKFDGEDFMFQLTEKEREYLQLSMQITDNIRATRELRSDLDEI